MRASYKHTAYSPLSHRRLRGWVGGVLTTLFITLIYLSLPGCGSSGLNVPVTDSWSQPLSTRGIHQVRPGETLYSVAWRYGRDYRDLARINHIQPPYKITTGQRIYLTSHAPSSARKKATYNNTAQRRNNIATKRTTTSNNIQKTPEQNVTSTHATTRMTNNTNLPIHQWQWPVRGKLLGTYGGAGGKGINIAAPLGTPVSATSAGRVVYCGNSLRGYGELIIIKHNEEFLSAYAHNSQLLVHEGDRITAGQTIAKIGDSEANRVMLHFEIRRAGKPVDPLQFLPKQ